ncbi:SDR family oxidoreductase [Paraliomyxa miuraensis]|uniref:SDR family oxidoreductase n=1 Tax=Paraliomyxa miuraensis TaxID=376150 RepID=UPI002257D9B3|nr:SDR family oxidoreductase [Paraliomyxa miuraensis]MCX4241852.1 SDR family oxidoreductase [Paraliomyxa miuraensis]
MSTLEHQVVVITGASRGLGRAAALRCAQEGALVAVGYASNDAAAQEVVGAIEAAGGRAFAIRADLSSISGIDSFYATLDRELETRTGEARFDTLVSNAGIVTMGKMADTTEEDFDRMFALNVKGSFFMAQRAISRLRDGGHVMFLSTGLTRFTMAEYTAYSASKGAIDVLTKCLAKELGPRGISVNAVAPGVVDTDINAHWLRDNPQAQAHMRSMIAMDRIAEAQDIGDVIAWLASKDSRWVTGQRIEASGGQSL